MEISHLDTVLWLQTSPQVPKAHFPSCTSFFLCNRLYLELESRTEWSCHRGIRFLWDQMPTGCWGRLFLDIKVFMKSHLSPRPDNRISKSCLSSPPLSTVFSLPSHLVFRRSLPKTWATFHSGCHPPSLDKTCAEYFFPRLRGWREKMIRCTRDISLILQAHSRS